MIGLDWVKSLIYQNFYSHFFQSACEASGSVQTLVLISLNYLFFQKKFAFI